MAKRVGLWELGFSVKRRPRKCWACHQTLPTKGSPSAKRKPTSSTRKPATKPKPATTKLW